MHLQSLNTSWDAYPDPIHNLDEISFDKVQKSIEVFKSRGVTINESPLSFLTKYDLIRKEKPTNAAYLMFKNKESIATTIELGRFQDAITIKDTSRSQADIITQVEHVLDFVKKHINVALIITGEAQNIQKWQYPLEAIREIVLNMIIHRDYCAQSDSVVKIFNDKIEFYNPGKLPDGISIQDLLDNNYKSTPRNKTIAEFFKNLGWIEKYGSGIGRIINYFKDAKLTLPTFENHSGGFLVTVFTPNNWEIIKNDTDKPTDKPTDRPTDRPTDKLSTNQTKILKYISENPAISSRELADILEIRADSVRENISKLKQKGLLKRIGPAKGGYWQVLIVNC